MVAVTPSRDPTVATEYSADQLRVLLARGDISGRELARRMGVRANWVSERTTRQRPISSEDAIMITRALGVGLSELMPELPALRRLAPVLVEVQLNILDNPASPDEVKQALLRAIRASYELALAAIPPRKGGR